MKKIGYFEAINGCAGDMIAASLIDAGLDFNDLKKELQKIPVKDYEIEIKKVKREGFGHTIQATQFLVKPEKFSSEGMSYREIIKIIEESKFDEERKNKIKKTFEILAEAERKVHGKEGNDVHFHQIGQIDAIIEISSAIIGLELLGVEKVYSSSIGVSNMAPATAEIIKGLPVWMKNEIFEISTPTGVAILKGISDFSPFTADFYIERVGFGTGIREKPFPNIIKFFTGKIIDEKNGIVVIETVIDDMSPVMFENLMEKLFKEEALDVSIFSGMGKKNRPVFKIEIIAPDFKLNEIGEILFRETTTIGFRYRKEKRMVLEREIKEIETEFGKVRVKFSYKDGKLVNVSPEYDDCKKLSEEKKVPLKEIYRRINKVLEI